MNRKDLYQSFCEVDDDILERSETASSYHTVPIRRRLPAALIAAMLCLCLMGAGVVAIIYADSIQNWFGHYFELVTGQEMSQGQTALIDHLSQDINQSQTVGETIVTVDSVTMGDDSFYLLLRVEGVNFLKRHHYDFEEVTLELSPDPMEGIGGVGSYGLKFHGLDGDGAALFLMDHSYGTSEGFKPDPTPLEVHLLLVNLVRGHQSEKQKMMTEGIWEFSFTLDRSQPPESISLPDTEVMGLNLDTEEEECIVLSNIELTNTGIRFQYNYENGTIDFRAKPEVSLENGATICWTDGSCTPMRDRTTLNCSYHWIIPVNLDEVVAVRIGEEEIPVF